MANEITVTASLSVSNGGYEDRRESRRVQSDQVSLQGRSGPQLISTTGMQLEKGNVTDNGFVHIRNLDSENFVEIGIQVSATFESFAKLLPGEVALFRATRNLYAKSDTAPVLIDFLLLGE